MCKCQKMLQPYVDWCKQPPNRDITQFILNFHMATNEVNRFFVSYTNGTLSLDSGGKLFRGKGKQIFSNRTWKCPPIPDPPGTPPSFDTRPIQIFNPDAADDVAVDIDIETGHMTLTLPTGDNAQDTADLRCSNGILYGFFNQGFGTGILLSLKTDVINAPSPPPR